MSTLLHAITNVTLDLKQPEKTAGIILKQLKELNFDKTSYINAKGETIKENNDWTYEIEDDPEYPPLNIDFHGSFAIIPTLYEHGTVLFTIYKLSLIYENYRLYWFEDFRKDLYKMVKMLGGTEVIFLADNAGTPLCEFLDMAQEDCTYETVKERLNAKFGQPVTDYSQLDYESLDYAEIKEFFLDDFKDLKKNSNL